MSILFSRRICSSTTQQPEFPGNNPPCWKPNGCVSGHSSPSLVAGSSQTFWRRRKNSKNITTWADDHGDQGRKPPKWLCNRSIGLLLWADPHWPQEQCCWHGLIAQGSMLQNDYASVRPKNSPWPAFPKQTTHHLSFKPGFPLKLFRAGLDIADTFTRVKSRFGAFRIFVAARR